MMALRSSVTLTGPSDFSSQSLCSSLKRASVSSGSSSPRLGDDGPTPGGGNVGWARADSGRPAGPRPLGLEPLGHGCGNGLDSLTSVPRDCCRPGVPPDAGCPDDSLAASWDVRTRRQGISRRQDSPYAMPAYHQLPLRRNQNHSQMLEESNMATRFNIRLDEES